MLDLKRFLFTLEPFSPRLARGAWALNGMLTGGFSVSLGLQLLELSDNRVAIRVPYARQNRDEYGALVGSAILTAAEQASRLLWVRHLDAGSDRLRLAGVQAQFVRPAESAVHVSGSLSTVERDVVLRELRLGRETSHEMAVSVVDQKDQLVAQLNLNWMIKPMRPVALPHGGAK
jgi:acyl-coenzyme A thioesterase PaaI-like protein